MADCHQHLELGLHAGGEVFDLLVARKAELVALAAEERLVKRRIERAQHAHRVLHGQLSAQARLRQCGAQLRPVDVLQLTQVLAKQADRTAVRVYQTED